ncbi:Cu,Zn superoxide dismutase-like protein, partial [Aspergillus brunneoviolaceus CBS 621.78]
APVITNNQDLTYVAHILRDPHSGIEGVVTASPGPNNTGVQIKLHFSGLRETSKYLYHIHYQPMPESGDCKGTAGLLNPYNAQEDPCNAAEPQTCGVGDLSGKHGFLIADDYGTVAAVYEDKYLSNQPDSVAFFGNRSVTIHADDGGRYNCGNFEL